MNGEWKKLEAKVSEHLTQCVYCQELWRAALKLCNDHRLLTQ